MMGKFDCQRGLNWRQSRIASATPCCAGTNISGCMDYEGFLTINDLSSLTHKYCTSAPFSGGGAQTGSASSACLFGGLIEIYSMTEGAWSACCYAHEHPDKLHTVGIAWGAATVINPVDETAQPSAGLAEMASWSRPVADDDVGAYKNSRRRPREPSWYGRKCADPLAADGAISAKVTTADGLYHLMGRSKDMIISGGFNIYRRFW